MKPIAIQTFTNVPRTLDTDHLTTHKSNKCVLKALLVSPIATYKRNLIDRLSDVC